MVSSGAGEAGVDAAATSAARRAMIDQIGATDGPVSRAPRAFERDTCLERLLEVSARVGSAGDSRAWGFVVVQGRDRVLRYSDRAKALLLSGTAGDSTARCVSDVLESESFDVYFDVGTLVAICAPEGDRYAEADCWLAARRLELEAFARGLGACSTRFAVPLLRQRDVREELGIPDGLTCFAALVVGAPRAVPPAVPRVRPSVLAWVR